MRLYWRIVLPFVLGLVLVISAGTFIASALLGREADRRLEAHLGAVARRMAEGGFALNRPLLDRLKVAVGAEVVVAGPGAEVLAATFPDVEAREAARLAAAAALRASASARAPAPLESATVGGAAYKVLFVPAAIDEGFPTTLAFFAPLAPMEEARASIARTLALVSLGGLLLMFVWGHLITRSITRPIDQLVASTQAVAGGELHQAAAPSRIPELAAFGRAFDHMVTKIRESEARLVRSERLAAMGRIAATVAHEVRNPLTAIRMLAQFLRRSHPEGTPAADACRNIVAEIDRLEMLVKGLLEVTHARPLRPAPMDVGDLLREASALMEGQLRHRRIALGLAPEPGLPLVMADRDRLKQVLLNLILNAADAMPDGGSLTLSAARTRPGARFPDGVEMVVADTGSGLSDEARRQAFEPFFSTKPEGAGLGLTVCRRIVDEHRGRISVENRPGGGAVATVWLPLAAEGREIPASPAAAREE